MPKAQIDQQALKWGARTYVMGILNITPDSFSGDGLYTGTNPVALALRQAGQFLQAGAEMIDIGGESTRPGADLVSTQAELERVVPVIRALSERYPQTMISVDTYKAEVAEAALAAGAQIVNDVWGFKADPDIAAATARQGAMVILMHNRSNPNSVEVRDRLGNAYLGASYQDLLDDVKRELMESVEIARQAGIPDSRIVLDPGIGFGKTVDQNLELINRLHEIRALGFPVLLGPSRKSFIGYTLDLPPAQRLEGTAASIAVGIVRGADIVRVHDVEAMVRIARMTDALVRNA